MKKINKIEQGDICTNKEFINSTVSNVTEEYIHCKYIYIHYS